jgi:hypothetical protein
MAELRFGSGRVETVVFPEIVALERLETGAGIHPFGPAIPMPSLIRSYTLVTLGP